MKLNTFNEINEKIIFTSRPESIPGDMRPSWRIGLILLILSITSRGGKSSILRISVFNWALRNKVNQQNLLNLLNNITSPDLIYFRNDPTLLRAIDFGIGFGYIDSLGDRVRLSIKGNKLVQQIMINKDIYIEEKKFLSEIGKSKINETFVKQLITKG